MKPMKEILHFDQTPSLGELYRKLGEVIVRELEMLKPIDSERKVYYISSEFLMGKMLGSHLRQLGLYDEVEEFVTKYGYTMCELLDVEGEPALGNGGLGRLAACYLDSTAACGIAMEGISLRYHFGLFRQVFHERKQREVLDTWLDQDIWVRKTDVTYPITFKDLMVTARMYEMDIPGCHEQKTTLRLFDLEGVDESLVEPGGIHFDQRDIAHNLTLFLYPDDSTEDGRCLRLYQQYFMVSAAAQYILDTYKQTHEDFTDLAKHIVIQINDTHPSLIIPECIRLLMQEGMTMKDAIDIVSAMCAYTNHTILAEALETWPLAYIQKVAPQLVDIIQALDAISAALHHPPATRIIDSQNQVHMAHMDIHYGFSVNGVAALHTQILKHSELKDFHALYPQKFHNVTNGISFRRFLYGCNRELTTWIEQKIGTGFYGNSDELKKLNNFLDDEESLAQLLQIKQIKKAQFIQAMKESQGIALRENAIFDVQIKRLHEYKRQQMNALYIIHQYLDILNGKFPMRPIVYVFGAKAAPAYTIAKDIIHLLLCLRDVIEDDPQASKYIQICFIENYNVSQGELIIPAADLSEQISLASKEASGTGNMKLMANGAVTIGTLDGANVEIADAVGRDAIYIFGESSEQVIEHYRQSDYCAKSCYEEDPWIQEALDFIISDTMMQYGDPISLKRLYHELLSKDWFMTLLDVKSYRLCKDQALRDYEQRSDWARKMLKNIAGCSYFNADRSIGDYVEQIWNRKEGKR